MRLSPTISFLVAGPFGVPLLSGRDPFGTPSRSEEPLFSSPVRRLPQTPEEPGWSREGRPVEPLVGVARAARRHDDVPTLTSHVQPRSQPPGAVADLLLRRVSKEDGQAPAAGAGPRRSGERTVRPFQRGQARGAARPPVYVQD